MLSRVADSLYWMSRYLERAEHTSRLLVVNLFGRLDQQPESEEEIRWLRVLRSLSIRVAPEAAPEPQEVVQRLTFARGDPHSIVCCIEAARSNAREVREELSSEMWEQMNRLYLHVQRARPVVVSDAHTYEFLQAIQQGSYLFEGITSSTMSRDEGWYFIQLGRFLERVTATVNLLDAHLGDYAETARESGSADEYLEWANLLKSCTALEAYCRIHTANILPERGAAFLILDRYFPHSVRFGVERVQGALNQLSSSALLLSHSDVHRRLGKLVSSLSFDLMEEIVAQDVHRFLGEIRGRCVEIHDAVYHTCISYPLDQALTG